MKKGFFLLALAFMPFICLHGQDKIEQVINVAGKKTIIREVDSAKWMVYADLDKLTFSLVDDANVLVDYIVLPSVFMEVNDFEIYKDTVWFCGTLTDYNPVVGYFDISSFPNTQIDYFTVTGITTLNNIEILDGKVFQLVMIGDYKISSQIINAVRNTSGWDVYNIILKKTDGTYSTHDDITITDNYVVITSHIVDRQNESWLADTTNTTAVRYFNESVIWYMDFSALSGPLVTSTVYYRPITYKAARPFLIDKCTSDLFVTATEGKYTNNNITIEGIIVSKYSIFNDQGTVCMPYPVDSARLVDLCYNKHAKLAVPLIRHTLPSGNIDNRIYNIQPTLPVITVTGHIFPYRYDIHSLIYQSHTNNCHIGSAYNYDAYYNLPLIRFNGINHGNCSEYVTLHASQIDNIKEKEKGILEYTFGPAIPITVRATDHETEKVTICD